jgi:hypothetical protein
MRQLKIILCALALIIGPVLLESCCLKEDYQYFTIEDFRQKTIAYPYQGTAPITTTSVKLSEVAFEVEYMIEALATIEHSGYEALACYQEFKSNQTLTSVTITSSAALGGIPAGEPLNTLFLVDLYLSGQQVYTMVGMNPLPQRFAFRSTQTVTAPEVHVFTFRLELDDGRVFEMKSVELELIP